MAKANAAVRKGSGRARGKSDGPSAGARTSPAHAPPPPATRQAAFHKAARAARSAEIAEDYAETIADLIDHGGEARVVDVASRLGVTHVTVIRTVARLARDGLLTSKPYRSIFLTEAGRKLAERTRRRHRVVLDFLLALGVSEATARGDAEGMEHSIGKETLAAMERYLEGKR